MSEEVLKNVKHMLALGRGDTRRLLEIINMVKEAVPLPLSDYKYVQNLLLEEDEHTKTKEMSRLETMLPEKDEYLEILRIRLAEGKITIDEFKGLKKVLMEP